MEGLSDERLNDRNCKLAACLLESCPKEGCVLHSWQRTADCAPQPALPYSDARSRTPEAMPKIGKIGVGLCR